MYKVIGGDQKQYGPVTAEEVRQWIADGRLNAQSVAWAEGATDWKPLGSFPEFADALRANATLHPPLGAALTPGMVQVYETEILTRRPQVRIGECLSRSWELLKSNSSLLCGAVLIYGLISLFQFVPGVGIIYLFLKGVLEGGLFLIFMKRIRNQPAAVGELFAGFNIAFAQLLLAGVVGGLLSLIGMCCCFFPGLYLMIAWAFGIPLVIDRKLEFWSALELSRKVVTRVWFEILALHVLAFLPFLIGLALVYLLGGTKSMTTISAAQDVLSSGQPDMGKVVNMLWMIYRASLVTNLLSRAILIINLPFAVGALMYAYEDLFCARRAPSP